MTEGFVTNPKHPNVKSKVACIIPIFGGVRTYGHFQEDKGKTILENLECHKHYKAGVEYDIIIINHGGPIDLPGYTVNNLPNFGFSFGAYKQAWDLIGDSYDYYLFAEDDIAPARHGWLKDILLKFMSSKDIGAVGNFVEARSSTEGQFSKDLWKLVDYQRDMMYNLDGAYTFTSSKILKQVDEIGGLMVYPCNPGDPYSPTINECLFQLPIIELGYKIVAFDGFCVHGSDIFTGEASGEGKMCPMLNLNGRHKIKRVQENFVWLHD